MTELVVLSGKGGTGKTTVAASLQVLAQNAGLHPTAVDCDVDAANLYLVLDPSVDLAEDFCGGSIAVVDPALCTRCGICVPKCMFGAMVSPGEVDPYTCEGCGVCSLVCPEHAVQLREHVTGVIQAGPSAWGQVIWAHLQPGAGNSGKLVAAVRDKARKTCVTAASDLIISDGPPGIGCPVISSLSGADMALLVTEPSVSGHHDLVRIWDLCRHFGVPAAVAINKADLAPETTASIRAWCESEGLAVLGEIPFDPQVPVSIAQALPLVAVASAVQSPAAQAIHALWQSLRVRLALPKADVEAARPR
jgi:MinD superfamily P-loop ATPase